MNPCRSLPAEIVYSIASPVIFASCIVNPITLPSFISFLKAVHAAAPVLPGLLCSYVWWGRFKSSLVLISTRVGEGFTPSGFLFQADDLLSCLSFLFLCTLVYLLKAAHAKCFSTIMFHFFPTPWELVLEKPEQQPGFGHCHDTTSGVPAVAWHSLIYWVSYQNPNSVHSRRL